jgi:hypothetical protein
MRDKRKAISCPRGLNHLSRPPRVSFPPIRRTQGKRNRLSALWSRRNRIISAGRGAVMAAVLDFGSVFLIGFDLNLTLIERGLEDLCRTKEIQIQSSCSNFLLPIRLTKGKKSAPHGHPPKKISRAVYTFELSNSIHRSAFLRTKKISRRKSTGGGALMASNSPQPFIPLPKEKVERDPRGIP